MKHYIQSELKYSGTASNSWCQYSNYKQFHCVCCRKYWNTKRTNEFSTEKEYLTHVYSMENKLDAEDCTERNT